VTGLWFSPVSFTNKTDHHDITEILLKVALSTIKPTKKSSSIFVYVTFEFEEERDKSRDKNKIY